MSAQVIRPEFQLIEVVKSYVAQSGVKIAAGTIIARLFYPAGYQFTNATTGKSVISDSWNNKGFSYKANKSLRVIEIVATKKIVEFLSEEGRTVPSNLPSNRIRTVKLARRLLNSQVQAVRNTPKPVVRDEWNTPAINVDMFPGVTSGNDYSDWDLELADLFAKTDEIGNQYQSDEEIAQLKSQLQELASVEFGNAQSSEPLAESVVAISANDWNDEELWNSNVKRLKAIAKKLNLKLYGATKKVEIINIIKAAR